MIWIVVEADVIGFATSEQRTTVPRLTESIDNVETRGEAPLAQILMRVNVVEFTTSCSHKILYYY